MGTLKSPAKGYERLATILLRSHSADKWPKAPVLKLSPEEYYFRKFKLTKYHLPTLPLGIHMLVLGLPVFSMWFSDSDLFWLMVLAYHL